MFESYQFGEGVRLQGRVSSQFFITLIFITLLSLFAAFGTRNSIEYSSLAGITADQQSSAPLDVDITRQIRQLLTEEPGISVSAQNIQIITIDEKVTLKGVVATPDEEQRVVSKARDIAGFSNVINQLKLRRSYE